MKYDAQILDDIIEHLTTSGATRTWQAAKGLWGYILMLLTSHCTGLANAQLIKQGAPA
jgi:hypothetical protein